MLFNLELTSEEIGVINRRLLERKKLLDELILNGKSSDSRVLESLMLGDLLDKIFEEIERKR